LLIKGSGAGSEQIVMDPDPGGPKTSGSRSLPRYVTVS
jgi:hypothetical protein